MLLASSIGQIAHPFFIFFATVIAFFYSLVPNYAFAIAALTVVVMVAVFPITRRGTRSMMKMQLLAPELKKIQTKYKAQPGMSTQERQENRQRLNEEMMAFYKENGVSPTGGCLPMVMQLPIFWILYGTIRGLIHTTKLHGHLIAEPLYLSHSSRMYRDIKAAPVSDLHSLGINLASSVRTTGLSWGSKVPYIALILVAIALQYIQMKQLNGRNPAAAAANPQMQQMQKIFPIVFAVIYIAIPAGVNIYFIVSSLFRISQQEFMYRRDPHIRESVEKLRARTKQDPKVVEARLKAEQDLGSRPKGLMGRLKAAQALQAEPAIVDVPAPSKNGSRAKTPPRGATVAAKTPGPPARKAQLRAQNKRPRKAR